MSDLTKEQFIEREYKSWKERFEAPYEQEFNVKAMFELQWQYSKTPSDHIKTKRDILETIQRILEGMKLKPNYNTVEHRELLIFAKNYTQKVNLHEMFKLMLNEKLLEEDLKINGVSARSILKTKELTINIEIPRKELGYRGYRADYILNLTGEKEIDDYYRGKNRI